MKEQTIYRKITELGEAIDNRLILHLLLLRTASKEYLPCCAQVSFDELTQSSIFKPHITNTPWYTVVAGRRRNFQTTAYDLTHTLQLPADVAQILKQSFKIDDHQKAAIDQLIDLLSQISPDGLPQVERAFLHFLHKNWDDSEEMYGDIQIPKSVIQCMADLLDIRGGKIYDPCCGSGAMLLAAAEKLQHPHFCLYGQAITAQSDHITRLNLSAHNMDFRFGAGPANAQQNDHFPQNKFDYILANPPFNQAISEPEYLSYTDPRWTYGPPSASNCNFAWMQHIVYHMDDYGSAAVIMPNSTLTSASANDKMVRKAMIRSGIVEAIITFPKYLFYGTEIPFCLWLLNKKNANSEGILFVDITKPGFSIKKALTSENADQLSQIITNYRAGIHPPKCSTTAVAPLAQIANNDYILSPNLYLDSDYSIVIKSNLKMLRKHIGCLQGVPTELKEQLEIWLTEVPASTWTRMPLPDLYEIKGGISKPKKDIGHGYPMLDTATIVRNQFVPEALCAYIDASIKEQATFRLQQGDIILNRTSESVSALARCCVAMHDHNAVYSGYTKRLRPKFPEMLVPSYMAGFFYSEIYRKQISDLTPVFTTRASINNKTLSKIQIYFPDWEMQNKLGRTLYGIFQAMASVTDPNLCVQLKQIHDILIEQFITLPILKQIDGRSMVE